MPGLYSLGCTGKLGQKVHPWVDLLCLSQQGSQRRWAPTVRLSA